MDNIQPPIKGPALDMNALIADPSFPKLYANNFAGTHSIADATLVVIHGNAPTCLISMSWESLKILKYQVDAMIVNIENSLNLKIHDPKDIQLMLLEQKRDI
jgi:hypothetical protein